MDSGGGEFLHSDRLCQSDYWQRWHRGELEQGKVLFDWHQLAPFGKRQMTFKGDKVGSWRIVRAKGREGRRERFICLQISLGFSPAIPSNSSIRMPVIGKSANIQTDVIVHSLPW